MPPEKRENTSFLFCKWIERAYSLFFSPLFDVYRIITKIPLTKLDELNKILWYRTKYSTVKDREKEEYTSRILREKGSPAERLFAGKMWKVALELFR